jgi:uncharacterized protein (DUF2062 family)
LPRKSDVASPPAVVSSLTNQNTAVISGTLAATGSRLNLEINLLVSAARRWGATPVTLPELRVFTWSGELICQR